MANKSCSACDDLKNSAPNLIVNGLGDTECNSLANDTGLNPSSGHNDFTDLSNMNDCLIGNMEDEIELYDVCDWKDYMRKFVGNAWTVYKGIICSLRGAWTNIHNLWTKVNCINSQIQQVTIAPSVRGFRNGDHVKFATMANKKTLQTIHVYMDADTNVTQDSYDTATYGSKVADKDYIAILSWCADGKHMGKQHIFVWCSVRNDKQSVEYGRLRSQHYSEIGIDQVSIAQTVTCYLPKGSHLIMEAYCVDGSGGAIFRIHQVSMALIPVMTVGSSTPC